MGNEQPNQDLPEGFDVKPENTIPEITIYGDPNAEIEEEAEETEEAGGDVIDQAREATAMPASETADKSASQPTTTPEEIKAGVRAALNQPSVSPEDIQKVMAEIDQSTQEGKWRYQAAQEVYNAKVGQQAQASKSRPWYKFWG